MASTGAPHTKYLGVAVVGAITLAAGSMFVAGKDVKKKEGQQSVYRDSPRGETDARLSSAEVAQRIKVPKPGNDER
ncbi:hypothetical protein HGRIS_011579 [Hohenbuehelia grisea]|uniref:Uncharacterized protein n=1 Tax=Hohenbuehelia grisea TaxID=104357 RepID=A0ABR3JVI3_9AGAR